MGLLRLLMCHFTQDKLTNAQRPEYSIRISGNGKKAPLLKLIPIPIAPHTHGTALLNQIEHSVLKKIMSNERVCSDKSVEVVPWPIITAKD